MANKRRLSKKRIIDALHATKGAVYLAAKRLNCSHTSVYRYINLYTDVASVKDYYDGELVDFGETALRTAVLGREPWAVKYVLSTKGKNRGYTERHEHKIIPVWVEELKPLYDSGKVTAEEIVNDLGSDLAREFFNYAGIDQE